MFHFTLGNLMATRTVVCFIAASFISGLLFICIWSPQEQLLDDDFSFTIPLQAEQNESSVCTFPVLDPWDPTILKYIDPPGVIRCRKVQPELTRVDEKGMLYINMGLVNLNTTECSWRRLNRGATDNAVDFGEPHLIRNDTEILTDDVDFFDVHCAQGGQTIYYNLHTRPRNFTKALPPSEENLSVLLFFLDSVSHSMFRRRFKKSYDYLVQSMGAFLFWNFNKIDDNTLVNIFPMMTGRRAREIQKGMPREFDIDVEYTKEPFDWVPFLWNNYSAKGYLSTFHEDFPRLGLFHYEPRQGFTKKPTDYFYRTFYRAMELGKGASLRKRSSSRCFGNQPIFQHQLDAMAQLYYQYGLDKRLFTYFFHTELTHDSESLGAAVDDNLKKFFEDLINRDLLNRTVLFVAGDHGHRFARIRETEIGRIEERLPLFSIRFPPWFLEKRPQIAANLRTNEHRLSTPFDVYETLGDILNSRFEHRQRPEKTRGLSQLYRIPANRTCFTAGIPDSYCVCTRTSKSLSLNSSLTIASGNYLVAHVNKLLNPVSDKCEKLELSNITSSTLYLPPFNQVVMQWETSPNAALFEAIVNIKNGKLDCVSGDVSRLDRYGNQSACIQSPHLKKFCYCKL